LGTGRAASKTVRYRLGYLRWYRRLHLLTSALLITIGFFAVGCEAPTDLPVDSERPSFGAIASSNLGSYYYPHRAGVVYVYSNKLVTFNGSNPSTVNGNNDTVRTLGFQGFDQNDSIFAISITYQTAAVFAGRAVIGLRYLPTSSSFGGAYINGNTYLQGETVTTSLATRATSTDSTTAPSYGRMRAQASDLAGVGTAVWQTDTIYFASNASHVALFAKTANGTFIRSKDLFREDVAVMAGNEWAYSTWQSATKFKVINENEMTVVGSTTLSTIHAKIENPNLATGSTSEKFFAPGYGQVRQVETFWTTLDGSGRVKQILVREGVVVIDLDEIAGM
jgi:hypothetical protein